MKNIQYIIVLVAILISQVSIGQSFYLKMDEVSKTTSKYTFDISVAGSTSFGLGSSNLVFNFNPAVLANPSLASHSLTEMVGPFTVYSDVSVTEPASGKASLNIVLDATGVGDTMDAFVSFTNIARVEFDIVDAAAPIELNWSYLGGTTETVVFAHDESTQLFADDPSADLSGISSILPIKLEHFDVQWYTGKRRSSMQYPYLQWTTSQEINVDHFEIERSFDGLSWQSIGKNSAEGNSTRPVSYEWEDVEVIETLVHKVYYRLKSVDINGSFEFSSVQLLVGKRSSEVSGVKIFPTVFSDILTVQHSESSEEDIFSIRLTDATGNQMIERTLKGQSEVFHMQHQLSPGFYIVQIFQNETPIHTARVIKQ